MKLSYNWLKEFVPSLTETPAQIAESLSHSLAEVESITPVGADFALEIENKALSHRGDLFSQTELSREVAASLSRKFEQPSITHLPSNPKSITGSSTQLQIEINTDADLTPRYSGIILDHIQVGPSPKWLVDRLLIHGLRSINNVVDVTNYIMLKYGQPLHAFDATELNPANATLTIETRPARTNETLVLLNGQTVNLTTDDLVVAKMTGDQPSTAIALAGIMGGDAAQISEQTTQILLESANFNMYAIRATSRRHGLRSEASLRFEKGIDPNLTLFALLEATEMLSGSSELNTNVVDNVSKPPLKETTIKLNADEINYYLNTTQNPEQIINTLVALDFNVDILTEKTFSVTIPSHRPDVKQKEDLYEEIGRIYDYNKIVPTLPQRKLAPPIDNSMWQLKNSIRQLMNQLGGNEVLTYSFTDQANAGIISVLTDNELALTQQFEPSLLKITNPIAPEFGYLRSSIIPSLTAVTLENAKRFKEFTLYEVGLVTHPVLNKTLPDEPHLLSIIHYTSQGDPNQSLVALKSTWLTLLNQLGINQFLDWQPLLIPLSETPGTCFGYEIDLRQILPLWQALQFQPIALHPTTFQDLSFKIDANQPVGPLIESILEFVSHRPLPNAAYLIRISLIDLFQNEQMQTQNEKSLTLRLEFQHPTQSLSDAEVTPIREDIQQYLIDQHHATIR